MTKFYPVVLATVLTILTSTLYGQQRLFSSGRANANLSTSGKREIIPEKYSATSVQDMDLKNFLWSLPNEKTVAANRGNSDVMELPMPDGTTSRFRVWEAPVMEPALAAKYPGIRTFAGQGIDDPTATVRMSYGSAFGFNAQILSATDRIYIDPYAKRDKNNYISYYHKDNHRQTNFSCLVEENTEVVSTGAREMAVCRGTQLYTYRLAIACTGEYAAAVGATNQTELTQAIVTTVTRVNGVYEKELAVRLVLIGNNDLIQYLDAGTDQFNGNNNANTLIAESQSVITSVIGSGNFDIGHTFSTGGGGLAGLRVVCNTNSKARGITGSPNPVGDGYDIDYVAHEMGHQFGGNHTFNSTTSSCGGGNRNAATAYEVGSGTTIQAYAGICASDNIQPNSDPYFHPVSFDEISTFLEAGGASCKVATATGNNLPVITSMGTNNLFIPNSTPFTLTGTATDADGDALTYSWEEWDLGPSGIWNSGANSATAPLFKSRVPKTTGVRTFPDMAVILAGFPTNPAATMGGLKGETLPIIGREIKFRLTVRDNRAGGGGVVSGGSGCASGGFTGEFKVTTVDGTGPFLVSVPNGGESYPGGSTQTVTWSVAGTDQAPINATNVKISMSTDGGQTYPIVLAASTPNDGSESITIPVGLTTTARVKIEAVDNVFFDISNANFSVTAAVSGFEFTSPAAQTVACAGPASVAFNLGTNAFSGFSTPIVLTASGNPAGTTVSFSPSTVNPGSATTVTVNGLNTVNNGAYTIRVTGTAGAITATRDLVVNVQAGTGPAIGTPPASVAACVGTNAQFSVVSATALSYQWQVSTNGGANFTNVAAGGTGATYTVNSVTTALNNNQYRVLVTGQCGITTSAAATLTVQTAPAIGTSPQSQTLCLNSNATFNVAATGTGLTYQWQVSTGGGAFTDINLANASSYTVNGIQVAQNGNQYRVLVGGTCTPQATSAAATLNVISPVEVTVDPQPIVQCETGDVSFSVTGAGTGIIYKWQRSIDGVAAYEDVANGGVYSGATTATLTLTDIPANYNNYRYRALLSNATCTTPDISAPAILTVNARPTVTLSAPSLNIQPGQTSTITASIVPSAAGFNISWYRNDALIPNVTGTTFTADVTTLGSYRVDIVNPTTGCDNQSQVLVIGAAASERLFIFPSPNTGQFTVSYYNTASGSAKQTISIFDSKGARVYSGVLNVTGPYTLHQIDLRGKGSGIYYIVLGDGSGKKIIDGKVMVGY